MDDADGDADGDADARMDEDDEDGGGEGCKICYEKDAVTSSRMLPPEELLLSSFRFLGFLVEYCCKHSELFVP